MYIVIAGGGKIGEYLAAKMLDKGNEVAVIEEDGEKARYLSATLRGRYLVILGDGCDSRFQEDAGIDRADVFVAVTGQDDSNLVACEIAQRVFEVPRCIARVNSPKNLRIFRTLGIESVSSTTLIAKQIEQEALFGGVGAVASLAYGNVGLEEMNIPRMHHHDNVEGVPAADVPLPAGALIVAVSHSDDVEVLGKETRLLPGDGVIVAADMGIIEKVRSIIASL